MIREAVILLVFLVSIFLPLNCPADIIALKNKESIEGIVVKEEEDKITIEIGFGTITLPCSEIESIEKSDEGNNARIKKKWQKKYFDSYPAPGVKEQKLLNEFKQVDSKKRQLQASIIQKGTLLRDISRRRMQIAELRHELDVISERLKSEGLKEDVKEYNNVVVEFNSVSNDLHEAAEDLNELQNKQQESSQLSVKYLKQLLQFSRQFEEKYNDFIKTGSLDSEKKEFYENLNQKLIELKADIRGDEVKFIQDKDRIIVKVVLNNVLEADMLVDTGAALTIISQSAAQKLGLDYKAVKEEVELTGVGGKSVKAKYIILNSVKVHEAEVKDVEAAIVEDGILIGLDGFLGMSFLKNFLFSLDAEGQKLLFNFLDSDNL